MFKLPAGTYNIEAHYSSEYWLTVVRTKATEQVSVDASSTKTVILDFPPAVWTTIGFWVLILCTVMPALALVFFVLYKKGKLKFAF